MRDVLGRMHFRFGKDHCKGYTSIRTITGRIELIEFPAHDKGMFKRPGGYPRKSVVDLVIKLQELVTDKINE